MWFGSWSEVVQPQRIASLVARACALGRQWDVGDDYCALGHRMLVTVLAGGWAANGGGNTLWLFCATWRLIGEMPLLGLGRVPTRLI